MITRRGLTASTILGLGGAAGLARSARAQGAYPNRPIRMFVPYAAGGGQDITARLLAEPIRAALGQPVVVENRSGAAGMIAAQATAQSPGDGYTLMLGGAGETAINQHLFHGRMAYDPEKDLRPIALVVKVPIVVMVNPAVPVHNPAELVAYAKANPGKLSYSSSGIGNPQHLAGEYLNHLAGINTVHVPYRGSGPAVTDIAAGAVQMGYNSLASGLPLIQSGQIRAVAVTSKERLPQLPDVPALAEYAPISNYELVNWFGVFAPAGVSDTIAERLYTVIATALQNPELKGKFETQGLLVSPLSPTDYRAFVISESAKFGQIVRDANVTAES
jgi:tripartite-type tricarboxylate transporter receptor subunit TctC